MNDSPGNNDKKLQQWLEGDLSQEEWDQYKESSDNVQELERLEQIARHAQDWTTPAPKLSAEEAWIALQQRIGGKDPSQAPVVPLWRKPWVAGIAASLLLIFCVWYFWGSTAEEIYTPKGATLSHSLPDNSSILLNADSKITYLPRGFKKERVVKLEGEAFFEIRKGSSFVVESNYGEIKVLGTSFNVYSRSDKFEVACAQGKVQVSIPGQDPVVLTAGMVTTLQGEALEVSNSLNEKRLLDWQQGNFYFRNAPLTSVLGELERQLGLKIIYNSSIDGMIYTGFFNRNRSQEALQSVLGPMGLKYQIRGDTVIVE